MGVFTKRADHCERDVLFQTDGAAAYRDQVREPLVMVDSENEKQP